MEGRGIRFAVPGLTLATMVVPAVAAAAYASAGSGGNSPAAGHPPRAVRAPAPAPPGVDPTQWSARQVQAMPALQ
ncbi:MAG: hypothetical protein ACRDWN_06270, partial [Acidimicrobiales bacterium]